MWCTTVKTIPVICSTDGDWSDWPLVQYVLKLWKPSQWSVPLMGTGQTDRSSNMYWNWKPSQWSVPLMGTGQTDRSSNTYWNCENHPSDLFHWWGLVRLTTRPIRTETVKTIPVICSTDGDWSDWPLVQYVLVKTKMCVSMYYKATSRTE